LFSGTLLTPESTSDGAEEGGNQFENTPDPICSWDHSLLHLDSSSSFFELITIVNSSTGGVSFNSGTISIIKGEFENNNPLSPLYPSMRRNILCSSETQLHIVSLKGGDGVKDNSSLWILPSSGCVVSGIGEERASTFFIPTLINVTKEKMGSTYHLTFNGTLFLPCSLSFSILIGDTQRTSPISISSYFNETLMYGSVELSIIDSSSSELISVVVIFPSFHSADSVNETTPFIIQNRSDQPDDDDDKDKLSQSTTPSDPSSPIPWIIIVIVLAALFIIALSAFLYMMYRKRK
jgi:hypothetical protein